MFLMNWLQMREGRTWQFAITITFETVSIFKQSLMLNILFFLHVYNPAKK